jgi:hypothetical protein
LPFLKPSTSILALQFVQVFKLFIMPATKGTKKKKAAAAAAAAKAAAAAAEEERSRSPSPEGPEGPAPPPGPSVQQADKVTAQAAAKKKKRLTDLTPEQEQEMVEWLEVHPLLWNKKMFDYKDKGKKEAFWITQADKMGKELEMIMTWYRSIRTRFGRLKKQPSGSGQAELTERDQWVLAHFEFLRPYISEVRPRVTQSVSRTNYFFQHFTISQFHDLACIYDMIII